MTYISSQSISMPLRLSVMQAQADLARAQTEISSGTYADIGLTLGGRTGTSLSLKSEIDRLGAFSNTNATATTRLASTSTALDTMISAAQGLSASLTTASSAGGSTVGLASSAQGALQSLVGALNTSVGGQFVFAGIKTDTTPVASYTPSSGAKQAVDTAFQSTFGVSQSSAAASSIDGTAMQSFLDSRFGGLFNDAGWQADWSSASSQTVQTDVAPSQTVSTSVSANETSFRQIAQAYTMLSEFTGQNLSDSARSAVVATASKLLNTGLAGLTNVASGVGIAQNTISTANTQISAQVDVLKTNVDDLDNVDTYALSTKVTQLQTQLQASYELTSRLSQLNLATYLTG